MTQQDRTTYPIIYPLNTVLYQTFTQSWNSLCNSHFQVTRDTNCITATMKLFNQDKTLSPYAYHVVLLFLPDWHSWLSRGSPGRVPAIWLEETGAVSTKLLTEDDLTSPNNHCSIVFSGWCWITAFSVSHTGRSNWLKTVTWSLFSILIGELSSRDIRLSFLLEDWWWSSRCRAGEFL